MLYESFRPSGVPLTFVSELLVLVSFSFPSWTFMLLALPPCLRHIRNTKEYTTPMDGSPGSATITTNVVLLVLDR